MLPDGNEKTPRQEFTKRRDFVFCEVIRQNFSRIKRVSLDEERGKTKEPTDGTLLIVNDRGRLLFCEVVR